MSKNFSKVLPTASTILVGTAHNNFYGRSAMMRYLKQSFEREVIDPRNLAIGFEYLMPELTQGTSEKSYQTIINAAMSGDQERIDKMIRKAMTAFSTESPNAKKVLYGQLLDGFMNHAIGHFCKIHGAKYHELENNEARKGLSVLNDQSPIEALRELHSREEQRVNNMLQNAAKMQRPTHLIFVGSSHIPTFLSNYPNFFSKESNISPLLLHNTNPKQTFFSKARAALE